MSENSNKSVKHLVPTNEIRGYTNKVRLSRWRCAWRTTRTEEKYMV
ncbi:hypothetical protein [Nostoc piscinale]|nr:hypothetical protein [Nostoc piscinale]